MSVGQVNVSKSRNTGNPIQAREPTLQIVPVSMLDDWVDIHAAPETADNSGSRVTNPGAITRSDCNDLQVFGDGTTVMVRLKYDAGISGPTNPVVQLFGRDGEGAYMLLRDAASPPNTELTITVDTTNDITDGTFKYTDWIEVDMQASVAVRPAIKTAFNGTGTLDNSTLQAKVK